MHSVVLVDDHQLVIEGFSKVINKEDDFEVISLFNDPTEAASKIPIINPDIVITDMDMPGMNGLQLIESIRKKQPTVKSILLTMHMNPLLLKKVKTYNFDGFLPKNTDEYELIQCLKAVGHGRSYFSQKILEMSVTTATQIETGNLSKTLMLSEREREILTLIVNGLSTKEISEQLFIAVRTVETHRKNIMEKMEVKNLAGMVRIAVREGY